MKWIHSAQAPWLLSDRPDVFTLRCWAEPGAFVSMRAYYSDPYDYLPGTGKRLNWAAAKMTLLTVAGDCAVWTCEVPVPTRKLAYHFRAEDGAGRVLWLGREGVSDREGDFFRAGYHFGEDRLPSWSGKSVWYQIFPDRFFGGPAAGDFVPTTKNVWGGTLDGIRQKIPYLRELGVTGVYLNPVFSSPSNHRYDTLDYTTVDARLGTNEDLIHLADELHRSGLRLMLDGVFNHASDRHPFFQDVKARGERSPYRDWFLIHDFKVLMTEPAEALTPERMKKAPPYECFAYAACMPKWNTELPAVQDYLIGAAEQWTRVLNLDAWRLDVPDEVSPVFLRAFRRRIRAIQPECLIIGEIWTDPTGWTQTGLFDGTMDYPLYGAVSRFLLKGDADVYAFCDAMNRREGLMARSMQRNQMLFMGNHDLPRCLTLAGGDAGRVRAAWALLCLMDGELNLYYGDERAMQGGEDPANRGVMQWDSQDAALEMERFTRETLALRARLLSSGTESIRFEALSAHTARVRLIRDHKEYVLFLTNGRDANFTAELPDARLLLRGERFALWETRL
jgi:glycosidase